MPVKSPVASVSLKTAVTMEVVSSEMLAARARLREKFGLKAPQLGGKGTARRKSKKVHKTSVSDDKKLQQTLKRHGASYIPGIEDVQIIREDGTLLTFTNPKVQAAPQSNTYIVSGTPTESSLASFSHGPGAEPLRRAFAEAAATGRLDKLLEGGGFSSEMAAAAVAAASTATSSGQGNVDKDYSGSISSSNDNTASTTLTAAAVSGKTGVVSASPVHDDDEVPDLIDNFEDVSRQ